MKAREINEVKKKDTLKWSKVAIIILNWNNYKDTKNCLLSLKEINYPNYEIIVIDNGSTDGSGKKLNEIFPSYTFILNKENSGYTGGNNLGIKRAIEEGVDYILILNNDTKVVNPNFLYKMTERMNEKPSVGIMGPKVFGSDGIVQETILFVPTLLNSIRESLFFKIHRKTKKNYNVAQFVETVSGVCWLIRRRVIQNIGLLDEDYFMYGEEQDYCYRAEKAGWNIMYYPVESVVHYKEPENKNKPRTYRQYTYTRRNIVLFIRKHFGFLQALALAILFFISNIIKVIFNRLIGREKNFYNISLLSKLFSEIKYVLYMKRENDKTK